MLVASITKSNLALNYGPYVINPPRLLLISLINHCKTTKASQYSSALSWNLSMPYMELNSTFTTCFFIFLLLSPPYFSTGAKQGLESEIYEIDYRGPETHSSSPPPDHHHHATPLSNNRKASLGSSRVNKGSANSNYNHTKQEKVERIHG